MVSWVDFQAGKPVGSWCSFQASIVGRADQFGLAGTAELFKVTQGPDFTGRVFHGPGTRLG